MKRLIALLIAGAVLGGAAAGSHTIDSNRDKTVRREAARAAESAGLRASDALSAHVDELKLQAHNAASNPRLAAALRGNVDAATLRDLFKSEEWWQPYRSEFKVYAVAFESERLDVVEGMRSAEFAADLLVRGARERREPVAEIVMGKGWPYAAAAVVVNTPERKQPVVLVLAKPIDEAAVRKLSEKARGAVLLSDGKQPVIETGAEAERDLLRKAVLGKEPGPLYQPAQGSWAAAVAQVAPGLWMWTFASGAEAARETETSAATTKAVLWSVGVLLALLALVFGFRGAGAVRAPIENQVEGLEAPGGSATGARHSVTSAGVTGAGDDAAALGSAATAYHQSQPTLPATGTPGPVNTVTFGRYRLLDRLGEGGMAEVYTAVTFGAEGFRRTFVVKRLRPELARDATVVAQFIDEANMGSTLVHSNIIPVFDFGKVGEEYFLAQEYILGRDLGLLTARIIERTGHAIPIPVVCFVTHETLKALEYAHSKLGDSGRPLGIVHRDVSPSNVLVSARGEVKLFDFGIVKAEGRVTKTQHGVVKGNVSFMSPEQARGIDIDGRADLFSLGLVMYYCLTGEVLYHGNTTYELLVKAATGPGPDELARIAALPAPCATILDKALKVSPAERYQTAAEFAVALAPFIAGAAAETSALMRTLFATDFQQQELRFAAAAPTSEKVAETPGPGTQAFGSRRS
ncbi:MAG TPA: serine/threonine-protein kinase [Polyangia bacterium]|nr:serine/threonine-protein kinase [Polyangia bacterium]